MRCFINLEYNPSDMNNNLEPVYGGHMLYLEEENCLIYTLLNE